MSNYENIMVAIDFSDLSEGAGRRAVELARFYGARVVFLHVIEHFPEHLPHYRMSREEMDPQEFLIDRAPKDLKKFCEALGCGGAEGDEGNRQAFDCPDGGFFFDLPHDRQWCEAYDANGDLVRHGRFVSFIEGSDRPEETGSYCWGTECGEWRNYYFDGTVSREWHLTEDGERCGVKREWDRDGELISETDTGIPCE